MTTLSDHNERLNALDPTRSFIVQSPAGSGKTELLIQRFLVLLGKVRNPEEILAITFTRKAAAEMRTRVLEALEKAFQNVPPSSAHALRTFELAQTVLKNDSQYQWKLLENPNRLRIQTIDSLCASLTRQMPILSRFGAQPTITDNAEKLYSLAAQEVLATLEKDTPWSESLIDLLLHLDNDQAKIEKLFCAMLARRDQWFFHISKIKSQEEQRDNLEKNLQRCISEIQQRLRDSFPQHLIEESLTLIRFAAAQLRMNDSNSPIVECLDLTRLPDISSREKNKWLGIAEIFLKKDNDWRKQVDKNIGFPADKDPLSKEMKQRFSALLEKIKENKVLLETFIELRFSPPSKYTETQWKVLQALLHLLPVLTAQLHVFFQETGNVDFIEITQSALQALGDIESPTELTLRLDHKIQHILLDEFQDTSSVQLRLLEQLTTGWQPQDGRTLFLVGDPMQSIYRFRKAEVGLFLKVKESGVGNIKLNYLTLRSNFRSSQKIVEWSNEIFSSLMPQEENIHTGAIQFTPSIAQNETTSNSSINLMSLLQTDKQEEAKQIVSLIKQLKNENSNATIAILVRARSHSFHILSELEKANIAYRALEIESLQDRTLIQDLVALTRALLNLSDRTAWLSILRAPWCGVTLNDLHRLVGNDFSETIAERLQKIDALAFSPQTQERLKKIDTILTNALNHRGRQSFTQWIEGVWYALGGPACAKSPSDLNEVKIFFNMINQLEKANNSINISELEKKLASLHASVVSSENHCVEVMTLHKAKGLEFDHVILPGLDRIIKGDDSQLLLYEERPDLQGDIDLLLAPIKASNEVDDPIYTFLKCEEKKRAENEMTRLLYVAMTRAKKSLHLITRLSCDINNPQLIKKPASNSLLHFLWPKLESSFLNAIITPQENDSIFNQPVEINNELFRLAQDWNSPSFAVLNFSTINDNTNSLLNFNSHFNIQQAIGTVTHQLLQQICLQGIEGWNSEVIQAKKMWMKNQLRSKGLNSDEVDFALTKVEKALQNTLQDPKARWILNHQHHDSRTEYALTAQLDNEIVSIVIDRTFIDENGIRWIIDYKTTEFKEGNLEDFFNKEIEEHKQQLQRYARILSKRESCPVKSGLYFPLVPAWYEWEFEDH